jgi:hypothetical protein
MFTGECLYNAERRALVLRDAFGSEQQTLASFRKNGHACRKNTNGRSVYRTPAIQVLAYLYLN